MEENSEKNSCISSIIIAVMSLVVTLPLFIILDRYLPDWDWKFDLDRILLFLVIYLVVTFIFESVKIVSVIFFLAAIGWLTYGSYTNAYGFSDLFQDYKELLFSMRYSPRPEEIVVSKLANFHNNSEFKKAIDYTHPEVRNFAIEATCKHFVDEQEGRDRKLIQYFAVFKEINTRWHYVSDPAAREYFAKASETIEGYKTSGKLSGDCDDHSILMAAAIKAIGGTVRLVMTKNHLYPELLIEDRDIRSVNYLVNKLFPDSEPIVYHTDEYEQNWINLDYTASYPGGKFMDEEIISIWVVDK